MKKKIILLSLGGNLGCVSKRIEKFIGEITKNPNLELVWQSPEENTIAWGGRSRGQYINKLVAFQSDWSLEKILFFCKIMEQELGRQNRNRWSAREIDIDILWTSNNGTKIRLGHLHVPHPSMERPYLASLLALWHESIKEIDK